MRRILFSFWLMIISSVVFAETHPSYQFFGLEGVLLSNAENAIAENEKTAKTKHINIVKVVNNSLQPYGYFRAHVSIVKNNQTVKVYVKKGEAIRFSKIDITIEGAGRDNPELNKFKNNFPIKVNDEFNAPKYQDAKTEFFRISNNQGYIHANFTKTEVLIDLPHYRASMILHLQTGERYYYGNTFFGKSPYADSFLQRFIPYHQDEPISNQRLMNLQQSMSESFYFQDVSITPKIEQAQNRHIPIFIETSTPKSQKYAAAIGYGTFTGPRLTASANFRRLTNTGQHADLQLRLSSIITGFTGKYYIPGSNPLEDKWFFGGNYQRFEPKGGKSTSKTIFVGFIKKWQNVTNNVSLNFLNEHYRTQTLPYTTSNSLYPSYNLAYRNVDNLILPTKGVALNLTVQGASSQFFSTTSFLQTDLRVRGVYSPFSFARIVAKGEFGYTVANDLYHLPLTMRFFAGGLDSIRGFADSSIGPGRYLQVASLEYQNRVIDNWWGAIFYDTGTATNHYGSPLNTGVGVGVIYQSFIGPIRLYGAQAISKQDKPYSFEFSIGPEF